LAAAAGTAALAGIGEFAAVRIRPGPRTPGEIFKMVVTSGLIPFAATAHAAAGRIRYRSAQPRPGGVLLDRDGTLVADVPYNGDPALVRPLEGVRESLDRLRRAGIPTAVISNQSGVARGLVSMEQLERVNRRIEEILGPLGPWVICPHGPSDACACRKPAPGLIEEAARRLDVPASECVVIGDIGADVEAALAAGARPILVPRPDTRAEEIRAAPVVAPNFAAAIDLVLGKDRP
jgi:HAD superfamily hydrolase (TIGR01662 family)